MFSGYIYKISVSFYVPVVQYMRARIKTMGVVKSGSVCTPCFVVCDCVRYAHIFWTLIVKKGQVY
jgi:hypothetical protein